MHWQKSPPWYKSIWTILVYSCQNSVLLIHKFRWLCLTIKDALQSILFMPVRRGSSAGSVTSPSIAPLFMIMLPASNIIHYIILITTLCLEYYRASLSLICQVATEGFSTGLTKYNLFPNECNLLKRCFREESNVLIRKWLHEEFIHFFVSVINGTMHS